MHFFYGERIVDVVDDLPVRSSRMPTRAATLICPVVAGSRTRGTHSDVSALKRTVCAFAHSDDVRSANRTISRRVMVS